ncbi:MAG TPA: zf-HC2 domain-containing protein [Thermomicrobiales bacterium]|nr:zf-HC2 domain-containing protein [Thermomicrobiales bacterium]
MSDDTRERSTNAARDASAPPNGSDGNQSMLQPDGHLDAEMVSAWLDAPDDFSDQDRLAIETHLAGCEQCTQVAAELTAIVRAFQALPLAESPHSFALTPEMAGLTPTPTLPPSRLEEPANLHERRLERQSGTPVSAYEPTPWHERQMSRLRWATAIATLLFVFVFSADLLGNIDTSGGDDDDSAMMTDMPQATQASAAEEFASNAEATSTTSSGAAMPEEEEADDVARSSEETPNPAGAAEDEAAGSGPAATEASGGSQPEPTTQTTGGEADQEEEEAAPESADVEPTGDDAETVMTLETAEPEPTDPAQESDESIAAYSGKDVATEDQESNTLQLIELALVIVIAWLVVAMIALPRLRRPSG